MVVSCSFSWDVVTKDDVVESVDEGVFIGVVGKGLEFGFTVMVSEVRGDNVGFTGLVTEPQAHRCLSEAQGRRTVLAS